MCRFIKIYTEDSKTPKRSDDTDVLDIYKNTDKNFNVVIEPFATFLKRSARMYSFLVGSSYSRMYLTEIDFLIDSQNTHNLKNTNYILFY